MPSDAIFIGFENTSVLVLVGFSWKTEQILLICCLYHISRDSEVESSSFVCRQIANNTTLIRASERETATVLHSRPDKHRTPMSDCDEPLRGAVTRDNAADLYLRCWVWKATLIMCAALNRARKVYWVENLRQSAQNGLYWKRAHGDSPTLREELGFPSLGKQFESGEVWEWKWNEIR